MTSAMQPTLRANMQVRWARARVAHLTLRAQRSDLGRALGANRAQASDLGCALCIDLVHQALVHDPARFRNALTWANTPRAPGFRDSWCTCIQACTKHLGARGVKAQVRRGARCATPKGGAPCARAPYPWGHPATEETTP